MRERKEQKELFVESAVCEVLRYLCLWTTDKLKREGGWGYLLMTEAK